MQCVVDGRSSRASAASPPRRAACRRAVPRIRRPGRPRSAAPRQRLRGRRDGDASAAARPAATSAIASRRASYPADGESHGPGRRDRRVLRADLVDERGHLVGERGVLDLEHVLRVLLARMGEVEGADEDGVVRDRDLRVHEVVHRPGRPRRRRLAGEAAVLEQEAQRRRLPARVPVLVPLEEHLVRSASRRRPRRGRPSRRRPTSASVPRIGADVMHRRGDTDAAARRADALRDPVGELSPWRGREPGRTGDRRRRRPAAARPCRSSRRRRLPELLEVAEVARGELGESTVTMTFSSRVHESSVQFVEPVRRSRGRGSRTCGASGRGRRGRRGSGRQRVDSSGAVCGGGGTGTRPG